MEKQQRKFIKILMNHRDDLLDYLFKDNKLKQEFINNKKIKLPNIFNIILYYPYESNLKSFLQKNITYNELFNCLIKIIKGKYNDNWNEKYRTINPILLLLFASDFIKNDFNFYITQTTNTVNFYHDKIKIREQIIESFRIYYELINDKELLYILGNKIEILYTGVKIEEYVNKNKLYTGRYVDMIYYLNNTEKIYIEINEKEHLEDADYCRMREIYARTRVKIIQYKTSNLLSTFMPEIYNEFAKKFYKIDTKIGINLYMVKINKFKLKLAKQFSEINIELKNGGYKLKNFIIMLKEWDFITCENIIYKMIKEDILTSTHFVDNMNPKKLLKKDKLKVKSKYKLNEIGVTKILHYQNDIKIWNRCNDITEAYSKFMNLYFSMIEHILNDVNKEFDLIFEEYNINNNFVQSSKVVYAFGIRKFGEICKEYSPYEHNNILPLLIKKKGHDINFKTIKKKLANKITFDKFVKLTESKNVMKDYIFIEEPDIKKIVDTYEKKCLEKELESESDIDSDEEIL